MTAAEALFPAIEKLDKLLAAALRKAEDVYGAQSAADPYRGLYISEEEAGRLLGRQPGMPLFASQGDDSGSGQRLMELMAGFGLEPFDLDLLIVALAPELDLRYERLYAYLQDDVTKKRPSVDLALNLLCRDASDKLERRGHLSPESPLRRQGLVHLIAEPGHLAPPLLSCFLKVDDQIVKFLFGLRGLDARILSYCQLIDGADRPTLSNLVLDDTLKAGLAAMVRDGHCKLYLKGPAGAGKRTLAEALSREAGKSLIALDAGAALSSGPDFGSALDLAFRDARLLNAMVYVEGLDAPGGEERRRLLGVLASRIGAFPGIVLAGGSLAWAEHGRTDSLLLPVEITTSGFPLRRELWKRALAADEWGIGEDGITSLANRFQYTPRQVLRTLAAARKLRVLRRSTGREETAVTALDDLIAGAREESRPNMGQFAVRVSPKAGWSELVLPQDQKTQLLEICNQAAYRYKVYGEWGFDEKFSHGKGLNVLFSGSPGTGKTMAAEVIASLLKLDLYKIDLSQVVSKYIGDTEKNVSRVFEEARASNCILFFDEADALFGRRSEVRDAHDRYANVEIAFLLQQMEEYQGVSILATNLKQNIDEAFTRRLAFTIDFPFPDEASRRLIWESTWPANAPRDQDIDTAHLARTFRFSGGNIKNAVLAAAFLGAARGRVEMIDLLLAARRELEKMGQAPSRQDFGRWWDAVQERLAEPWKLDARKGAAA